MGVLGGSINKVNSVLASSIDKINGVSLVQRIWKSINLAHSSYYIMSAIRESDGTAWTWGKNDAFSLGTGDPVETSRSSPASVVGGHQFANICTGYGYWDGVSEYYNRGFGVHVSDGSGWAWGCNRYGRLGINTDMNSQSSPVSVAGNHSFAHIRNGCRHACGLRGDGTAWAFGMNTEGELGTGNKTNYSSPKSVLGNQNFTKVYCGYYSFAGLTTDGYCYTCGENQDGVLGRNNTTDYSSPVSVVGGRTYVDLSSSCEHCQAINASDGSGWGWGLNSYGRIGDGSLTTRSSPVSIPGNRSYKKVAAGAFNSLWLDGDSHIWSCGYPAGLGNGQETTATSPVSVLGDIFAEQISGGYCAGFALEDGGVNLWAWGRGGYGQLGTGKTATMSSPILVLVPTT